jgi:hypothetical protein
MCPDEIYSLMQSCWQFNPTERPTFDKLYIELNKLWREEKQAKNIELPIFNLQNSPHDTSIIYNVE